MCGIVAMLGRGPVASSILDALKRLEYRGYDSAGIATLEAGRLTRRRASGKLKNLELHLAAEPLSGRIGIGHTRWATHGRPSENNAHPHVSANVGVVHNGIIENFRELRAELQAKGHEFSTETDSEVIAHLVSETMRGGLAPVEAVASSLPRLRARPDLRRRGGSFDRRQQRRAACNRIWRRRTCWRNVSWLRCACAGPFHRHDRLSGGWRLRRPDPYVRAVLRCRRHFGGAAKGQVGSLGRADRQGQLSPFHGEGNPRATRGRRPHAWALSRHAGRPRGTALRAAGRYRCSPAPDDLRLRHGLYRGAHRQILVRAICAASRR